MRRPVLFSLCIVLLLSLSAASVAVTIGMGPVELDPEVTVNITPVNSTETYEVPHATVLGALDAASILGAFEYQVIEDLPPEEGNLSILSIAGIENEILNETPNNWTYWVNGEQGTTGPAVTNVSDGDNLTFSYGPPGHTIEDAEYTLILDVTVLEAVVTPEPTSTENVTPTPTENVTPMPTENVTPTPTVNVTPTPTVNVTPEPTPAVEANVTIEEPMEGASIAAGNVTVSVNVTNFTLVEPTGQENVPGEGHLHYYLDAPIPTNESEPAIPPTGGYIVSTNLSHTWENVTPGEHNLSVQLVNNDHTPLIPLLFETVNVTVTEEANVTPTPTVNVTQTPTVNVTPTPTVNVTPTPTVNVTPTPTVNVTPTPTVNVTPTPTVNVTPTPTVNVTPTPTVNVTPTPTVNVTPTPTVNVTPTPTVNVTPTPTVNVTPTPTVNVTPTPTVNVTPTPTVNVTPTPTVNVTPTPTVNVTPTPTVNVTPTPTVNVTPTPTVNVTPTPTVNVTPTPTVNVTPTPAPEANITELIVTGLAGEENLTTFVEAVNNSTIDEQLDENASYVICAPTNEAFAALGNQTLSVIMGDEMLLNRFIGYHIIQSGFTVEELVQLCQASEDGQISLPTVEGSDVNVSLTDDGQLTINNIIVITQIQITNKIVIYVIGTVLVPPDVPIPTPTPTVTPTPTPTVNVTPTPTVNVTPTPTVNVTPTPTVNVTPTPTVNVTPTPTVNVTPTPTVNVTPTPTVNVTPTPTVNVTPTPTVNVTPTPTVNVTPTPTVTPPQETVELQLYEGWNFVSIPRPLSVGNDTAGVVFADVDTGGRAFYTHTPAGGFVPLGENETLEVLEGYWVYSTEETTVELILSTDPVRAPALKTLSPGWNAIGFSDLTERTADETLTSVEDIWVYVVGYDAESQTYRPAFVNNQSDDQMLFPTEGYWLFVREDGRLAAISA